MKIWAPAEASSPGGDGKLPADSLLEGMRRRIFRKWSWLGVVVSAAQTAVGGGPKQKLFLLCATDATQAVDGSTKSQVDGLFMRVARIPDKDDVNRYTPYG
jgi:hypothetical protein